MAEAQKRTTARAKERAVEAQTRAAKAALVEGTAPEDTATSTKAAAAAGVLVASTPP